MYDLRDYSGKLDKKDCKLVYELNLDARRTLSEIKKCTGISEQAMNYRIKRLFKRGIITGFAPLLSADRLGMGLYRALLRLEASREREDEVMEYLRNNGHVCELLTVNGRWDLSVAFAARDPHSFFNQIADLKKKFSNELKDSQLSSITCCRVFKRKYLKKDHDPKRVAVLCSGKSDALMLNAKDARLLNALIDDGRAKKFELGKKSRMNQTTVKKRLSDLIRKGIIQGVDARIHPMAYGMICKRIPLRLDEHEEAELLEFARSDPNIVSFERTIGSWNYELGAECESKARFNDLMRRLRETFPNIHSQGYIDVEYNHDVKCRSYFNLSK